MATSRADTQRSGAAKAPGARLRERRAVRAGGAKARDQRRKRAAAAAADAASQPLSASHGQTRARELERLAEEFRRVVASLRTLRGRQARLGGQELSRAQFELLIELLEHGEMHVGELAQAAHVSSATVSGMLDHLVAGGHVERIHSERDRRAVVCRLTAAGRRRLEAHKAIWQARWEEALADASTADLRAAARVLSRLGSVFEEAAGTAAGKGPCETPESPRRA